MTWLAGLPSIKGYEVLEVIGKGGMGVVYKARHLSLNLIVALKVIKPELVSPRLLARFKKEGELLARLNHPNLVRVFDAGDADGVAYIAMEFVDGGSLSAGIHSKQMSWKEVREVAAQMAEGLASAHRTPPNGIIHRDLKPANVLLANDPNGGHASPKIADFGLAKALEEEQGQTTTGTRVGTYPYMAPEVALGNARNPDPRVDIYSLGATIYETLTGRTPFEGDNIIGQVINNEPAWPRRIRRDAPRDLAHICVKCLAKSPAERYDSADKLATDIRRETFYWRPSLPRRAWIAIRRHPITTTAAAMLIIALALAPTIAARVHPDYELHKMQATLARGEPVTLVGETGLPKWHRWRVATGATSTVQGENDQFVVQSFSQALLELMPHLPFDRFSRFEFSAEVQHAEGTTANVGLFFGLRAVSDPIGTHLCFCSITFSDLEINGSLEFEIRLRSDDLLPSTGSVIKNRVRGSTPTVFVSNHEGTKTSNWRRMNIELATDYVRIAWDGKTVNEITREDFARKLHALMGSDLRLTGIDFRIDLSGGLGLYVDEAVAILRKVVVKPLPPHT